MSSVHQVPIGGVGWSGARSQLGLWVTPLVVQWALGVCVLPGHSGSACGVIAICHRAGSVTGLALSQDWLCHRVDSVTGLAL